MVEVSDLILQRVRHALEVVGRHAHVRMAYVFGSLIQGTNDQDSDIDVAAFVDEANQLDIRQRAIASADVQLEVGSDVELHIFPAELLVDPPSSSFASYIQTHGLKIEPS